MRKLSRVHDRQMKPYCNLLYARIKRTIIPLFEDAFVACQILCELHGDVPPSLLERLHDRIQLALNHPPYEGGDLYEG